MDKDPYQVLGVARGAGEDEIRAAYRRLAKQYHPDLHPGDPNAAKRMNEINEAYDRIKNPQSYQQSQPYQQPHQQSQQTWQRTYYYDPFGFWGAQSGSGERTRQQTRDRQEYQDPFAGWYAESDRARDERQEEPGSSYSWTFYRPRRRGNLLIRFLGIYLAIQILAGLFGSCGYRANNYYDSGAYGYGSQSSSSYSGFGSGG